MRKAFLEQRVLVTLDKDFGELAVLREIPHCGIIQAGICRSILEKYPKDLQGGAIVTADSDRVRIRRLMHGS